jgi:hypothetical protein
VCVFLCVRVYVCVCVCVCVCVLFDGDISCIVIPEHDALERHRAVKSQLVIPGCVVYRFI